MAATNKGIYILDKNKTYLVDNGYGLPEDIVIRTAACLNNKIYLASSDGVYTIDLQQLRAIRADYTLSNLIITADATRKPYSLSGQVEYKTYPQEVNVFWEINTHPNPENLVIVTGKQYPEMATHKHSG